MIMTKSHLMITSLMMFSTKSSVEDCYCRDLTGDTTANVFNYQINNGTSRNGHSGSHTFARRDFTLAHKSESSVVYINILVKQYNNFCSSP